MIKIKPYLLFAGEQNGKAMEAAQLYQQAFSDTRILNKEQYAKGEAGGDPGDIKSMTMLVQGSEIMFEDSNYEHDFALTPALSLYIEFDNSQDLHKAYEILKEEGQELVPIDEKSDELFVWLNDKYGVSWQLAMNTKS